MRPAETTDIFIREDLSKPENRINVAMFGLMTQDWFRTWFLERLDLSTDAVVYPPVNESGKRPDFRVDSFDGSVLARIEVELGADPGQVANYAKTFAEPVKSVFGRRSHGGDLSLDGHRKTAHPRTVETRTPDTDQCGAFANSDHPSPQGSFLIFS